MLPAAHATELAAAPDTTAALFCAADGAKQIELADVSASSVRVHDCDASDQAACCAGEHATVPVKRSLVQGQIVAVFRLRSQQAFEQCRHEGWRS